MNFAGIKNKNHKYPCGGRVRARGWNINEEPRGNNFISELYNRIAKKNNKYKTISNKI